MATSLARDAVLAPKTLLEWPLLAESGLLSRPCPGRKSDRFTPKAAV